MVVSTGGLACYVGRLRIDLEFLAQKVAEAKRLLDQVTQVKKGIGTAKSGLERAATAVDAMKENLNACLREIADELAVQ